MFLAHVKRFNNKYRDEKGNPPTKCLKIDQYYTSSLKNA